MTSQPVQYPLSSIEMDLECVSESVPLFVLASARTFGVLVPLSTIPHVVTKKRGDPHQLLFSEVVDAFSEIAEEYVEMAEEAKCTLPLPSVERLGSEFSGELLSISLTLELLHNINPEAETSVLDGEYFFIAEAGVDITEFLPNLDKNGDGHTLH